MTLWEAKDDEKGVKRHGEGLLHRAHIAVPVPDAGVPKEVVDRVRDALRDNEKCSSAGRRFWELSGGIFRCADCGRALVAVTALKGPKGYRRRMFYYHCATRAARPGNMPAHSSGL